jgi:hypothetical protein
MAERGHADQNSRSQGHDERRPEERHGSEKHHADDDSGAEALAGFLPAGILMGAMAGVAGATSPLWIPAAALGDDPTAPGRFSRFPYDNGLGYMIVGPEPVDLDRPGSAAPAGEANQQELQELQQEMLSLLPQGRSWAGRFSAEYADNLDRQDRLSGELLLSTQQRFGIDTQWHYFHQPLPNRSGDPLWVGEFRTGFGVNWLNDPHDTSFGFNWTYGADFFPCSPWIFSSSIDWGILGGAGLFHGRSTIGVIIDRFEVYTGYDYYDLGRSGINSLVAGVRLWF